MKWLERELLAYSPYSQYKHVTQYVSIGGWGCFCRWETFHGAIMRAGLCACVLLAVSFQCQAATVTYSYDAALGTLPQQQGWTDYGSTSGYVTLTGGSLNLDSTFSGIHGWYVGSKPFLFSDGVTIEATLRINSSNHYQGTVQRAGYYLGIDDHTSLPIWTAIAQEGVWFHYDAENYSEFAPLNLADGQFHNFRFVANSAGFYLYLDDAKILDTAFRTGTWNNPNTLWFGDLSTLGISNTDLKFYRATLTEVPIPSAIWFFLSGLGTLLASVARMKLGGIRVNPCHDHPGFRQASSGLL